MLGLDVLAWTLVIIAGLILLAIIAGLIYGAVKGDAFCITLLIVLGFILFIWGLSWATMRLFGV